MRPINTLSRDKLTNFRKECLPEWQMTSKFMMLEKKYGNVLYLPLDIPRIEASDLNNFKKWFLEKAIPVHKIRADIANIYQTEKNIYPSFLSVDSPGIADLVQDGVWETNPVSDMYEVFPEVKKLILENLPFKSVDYYTLWSNMLPTMPHRDAAPLCDLPFAFRINLYDENPAGTLKLHLGLPDTPFNKCEFRIINNIADTNAFVWNNLRLLHSSTKQYKYKKILMIISPTVRNDIDYDKFEMLLDRSIEKYKDSTWIDTNFISDYINEC